MSARILVADDHPALVAAVASYLDANDLEVVGPATDGDAAVRLARDQQPELALVDWRMPRRGGADLVSAIVEASPGTRVLVYTADGDQDLARVALDAGAASVVLKEAPLPDLLRAIETTSSGRSYLDPALRRTAKNRSALTQRELEVLALLADGLRHEEIGARLGIGPETVRTHLRKASERLGATTRTQAVATAFRMGLIA